MCLVGLTTLFRSHETSEEESRERGGEASAVEGACIVHKYTHGRGSGPPPAVPYVAHAPVARDYRGRASRCLVVQQQR